MRENLLEFISIVTASLCAHTSASFQFALLALKAMNDRILQWFGLEGTLKLI